MKRYTRNQVHEMNKGMQNSAHFGQLEVISAQNTRQIQQDITESQKGLSNLIAMQQATVNKGLLNPEIQDAKSTLNFLKQQKKEMERLQKEAAIRKKENEKEVEKIEKNGGQVYTNLPPKAFSKICHIPTPTSNQNTFEWKHTLPFVKKRLWAKWWNTHPNQHTAFNYDGKFVTLKAQTLLPEFDPSGQGEDFVFLQPQGSPFDKTQLPDSRQDIHTPSVPDFTQLPEITVDVMPSMTVGYKPAQDDDILVDMVDEAVLKPPQSPITESEHDMRKLLPWIAGGGLLLLLFKK